MKPAYLVIDQGGHGTRALVFDTLGNIVLAAYAPLPSSSPHRGWFEQSAQAVSDSVQRCLQDISAQVAAQQHSVSLAIASAALITQRSSLLACYRDTGQPITPVISWQDTRNSDWLQAQIHNGSWDIAALKKLTGLRLNAHYGASKMRWLLDHDSAVQKADAQNNLVFLPLAAFVTQQLTHANTAVLDAVTASRTFLTEFGQEDWSQPLLDLFAIERRVLPAIVGSRSDFGNITIGDQHIPLRVVGGDQSFLPFAYGDSSQQDALFINAGTGAFVQAMMARDETPYALLCSVAALDQQQALSVAEGTVNACASALDWLFQQENTTLTPEEIASALRDITAPPVFYHRVSALGSPYWLAAGVSSFSEPASLAEKTVAVIESIIFLLAINIDLLQQAKPDLNKIFISGGIASLDGFCQKLANCTGLNVIRCDNQEASARGAAFYLAGIHRYAQIDKATTFTAMQDRALLARYQCFYQWLRNEWLQTTQENSR